MTTVADHIVEIIATKLGESTGRCPICRRRWRLLACGLLPPHHAGTGAQCPGSEGEPGEPADTIGEESIDV